MQTQFQYAGVLITIAASISVPQLTCSGQAPVLASINSSSASLTPPTTIADSAPGWLWDHMSSCDPTDSSPAGAHAGGPSSSGTYVFSGTGLAIYSVPDRTVSVASVVHRTGKLRITIDGVVRGEFVQYTPGQATNAPIFVGHGLPDGNHSLLVEPVDGWAAVSSIVVEHATPTASAEHDPLLDGTNSIPSGVYKILARSDMSAGLDVLNWSTANGAQMDLYLYQKQSNQKFQITKVGKGTYTLSPVQAAGSDISLLPDANDAGVYVGIWTNLGNPAQKWIISATPSGYCRISPASAPQSALTYDESQPPISGTGQNPVTAVPVRSYTGGLNQQWAIVSAAND